MGQRSVVMEKSVHRSNNCDVRPKPSDTSNVGEKGSLKEYSVILTTFFL